MEKIGKRYPHTQTEVLRNIDVHIHHGDYVAIVGRSGSGKSTMLHLLGLLDTPTSGVYRFGGMNVTDLLEHERARIRNRDIGFIFQAFFLMPKLTVVENVALALQLRGLSVRERQEQARHVLERVGMSHRTSYFPSQLSGGQKQRVAIARALLQGPQLILADEPTGNLDGHSSAEIMNLFQEANQEGTTVIVITHDLTVAQAARTRIELDDGLIVSSRPTPSR